MRIAVFSPLTVSRSLGATKLRVELVDALLELGVNASLFGAEDIGSSAVYTKTDAQAYAERLREFLWKAEKDVDVALFEADSLPFLRGTMPAQMLLVAQPAMVWAHHELINYPTPQAPVWRLVLRKLKARVRPRAAWLSAERRPMQRMTCQNADLVQCLNLWDADALRADGVRSTPMVTIPTGLSAGRLRHLKEMHRGHNPWDRKTIAFVGTFDYRKGCLDTAALMRQLWAADDGYRIKILGSQGLFQTELAVRRHFPADRQSHVEVVPRFESEQLPALLSDCTLGIFPSYIESFGIGCLETMAAGIPTAAYIAPGPESFVPKELMVTPGDIQALKSLLIRLSKAENAPDYFRLSKLCVDTAKSLEWGRISGRAAEVYEQHLARLRV